jgi:hypothetical protein
MENINFSELESIEGIAPLYIYGLGAFFLKQYYIDALSEKAYSEPGSLTQAERDLIKALAETED